MKVACIQMKPVRFQVEENLKRMTYFIEKAMKKKVDFIVFPELITSGYECGKQFINMAEVATDSNSIRCISKLAKKHSVNIIFGFPERDPYEGRIVYNSSVFIDDEGNLKGIYRKVHLFGKAEKEVFKAGDTYPVFDTSFGKIAMMICWDTAFPEVARIYALEGASIIFISTNWENPYSDDWDLAIRSRAADNAIFVAGANRVGKDDHLSFFGHSKIVSPTGKVMKALHTDEEGIVRAKLDLSSIEKLRNEYYTYFKDRRVDTYGKILDI